MNAERKALRVGKALGMAILLGAVAGAMLFQIFQQTRHQSVQSIACENLIQSCRISVDGQNLEVSFSATPSALKPFLLTVKAVGVENVSASFHMANMEMGMNRYALIPVAEGVWQAKVILPVCVAGRRDWILVLTLDESIIQIPFATQK